MDRDGTLDEVSTAIVRVLASVPLVMAGLQAQLDLVLGLVAEELMPARIPDEGGALFDTAPVRVLLLQVCGSIHTVAVATAQERANQAIAEHLAQHARNMAAARAAAAATASQVFEQ